MWGDTSLPALARDLEELMASSKARYSVLRPLPCQF